MRMHMRGGSLPGTRTDFTNVSRFPETFCWTEPSKTKELARLSERMASCQEWQNALAERSRWSPAGRAGPELVSFAGLQWMELEVPLHTRLREPRHKN